MQRNTGILGGSFNPIHNGHLSLANGFRSALRLDRVLLIPVASPPHKSGEGMADGAARFEMCRLACAGTPWLEPCDIELKRGGDKLYV
ncbi:MAG TPA: adenylyltransferase/cytidyltransferase family protein [Armatimonadota bacterium]|nr:adenylyltransferase/cytidyltransferase family protein [Armatimonadota bacterium]